MVGTAQRKVSRKTAMGLKGGRILWTARVPSLSCKQAQKSRDSAKKSEQKNSDGIEGGGGFDGQPGFPHFHVNRPKKVGTVQRKESRKTAMGLKGGGGILWTAGVPPLSCERPKIVGTAYRKMSRKTAMGLKGRGGAWEGIDVVPSTPPLLPFFSALYFAPLSTI